MSDSNSIRASEYFKARGLNANVRFSALPQQTIVIRWCFDVFIESVTVQLRRLSIQVLLCGHYARSIRWVAYRRKIFLRFIFAMVVGEPLQPRFHYQLAILWFVCDTFGFCSQQICAVVVAGRILLKISIYRGKRSIEHTKLTYSAYVHRKR